MTSVTVLRAPDASLVATLRSLDDAVRHSDGHDAVPEAAFTALAVQPEQCHAVATADGSAVAVTFPSDSFTPAHRQLAFVAAPSAGSGTLQVVVDAVVAMDHATLTSWLPGSDPRLVEALTDSGFEEHRRQHRMEVALPLREPADWPAAVTVTTFRPGVDTAAWLAVNNRAFANHPDQGGWIESVLDRRMAEPWFDPAGFLLAWRGPALLGFCWTKVHSGEPPTGEIFVIGVDPDAQGLGLGRALVLAGLADLAERRGCRFGILYVAADNTGALHLYESLGFRIVRTDIALVHGARS